MFSRALTLTWALVFAAAAGLALAGCGKGQEGAGAGAAAATPGAKGAGGGADRPVPVLVADVVSKDVPIFLEGLGTVTAYKTVNVRSQVDGRLDKVVFQEGQPVKQSELLAQIDPRPFEILLHQGEAALTRDQAQLDGASAITIATSRSAGSTSCRSSRSTTRRRWSSSSGGRSSTTRRRSKTPSCSSTMRASSRPSTGSPASAWSIPATSSTPPTPAESWW